jgi:ABC-type polysaccharide/polyol phosphate transport system ATPase subunit
MSVVISAENVGIEFYVSRRRKMQVRDLLFHGKATTTNETFWALRGISFDIRKGEAVGLVGGNGSGKSTLLKMIAGVLLPDEGRVEVTGGVAPLIELTGGFRGELTCRDNLHIQAALHGLSKEQIEERFESIVDFAGPQVREALDRPYRHLSSGMQVRLGFAVVSSLDEPIFLVDEVLAVGDKAFREKCYTRMEALLSEGRTLFLVSHSERDLKRFGSRGLYLQRGRLVMDGPMDEVLDRYNEDLGTTTTS